MVLYAIIEYTVSHWNGNGLECWTVEHDRAFMRPAREIERHTEGEKEREIYVNIEFKPVWRGPIVAVADRR